MLYTRQLDSHYITVFTRVLRRWFHIDSTKMCGKMNQLYNRHIMTLFYLSLIYVLFLDFTSADTNMHVAFWQGPCSANSFCEHVCITMDKGYICQCNDTYELRDDGHSCQKLKDAHPLQLDHISDEIPLHSSSSSSSSVSLSSSSRQSFASPSLTDSNPAGTDSTSSKHRVIAEMYDLKDHLSKDSLQVHLGNDVLHSADNKNSHESLNLMHNAPTCRDVECLNNGTCTVDRYNARCNCPLNTAGIRCEREILVRYPKFLGDGYLAFPVLKTGYKEFDIQIDFKPQANNGLLIFSAENSNSKSDFFSVAIINGYIEFRYDCGTGPAILRSKSKVNLGNWNWVKAKRVDNEGVLQLNDEQQVIGVSRGAYSRITLRLPVYLGGYEKMIDIVAGIGINKPYVGCVQALTINGYKYDLRKKDIVGDAMFGLNVGECSEDVCNDIICENGGTCIAKSADEHVCLCPLSTGGANCQYDTRVHIPEFGGHSYLKYPGLGRTALSYTEVEMVFKPTNGEGVILYNGFTHDRRGDFISLAMKERHLEFRFDLGTGPAMIRSIEPVALNQWHWVKVSRTGLQGVLEIDEQPRIEGTSQGAFTQLTLLKDLYIGGHDDFDHTSKAANLSSSFHGCIQKVIINEHPIELLQDAKDGVNIESCEHPCVGQPCLNNGVCVPDKDIYTCYCPLGYTNTNCEDHLEAEIHSPMFSGQSFLVYTDKNVNKRISGSKINIEMTLKPESVNGLLLWSGRDEPMTTTSDYLALGFTNGALQFRYNLGSGEAIISYNKSELFNGQWHRIRAQRDKQVGFLEIDSTEIVEGSSPGSYTMLNTNKILYIGGMPNVSQNTLRKFTTGYTGCVADFRLAEDYDVSLIDKAQSGRNIQSCTNQNVPPVA